MKTSISNGVYSVILAEREWYGIGETAQRILEFGTKEDAQIVGCQYVSIIVEPDELFSECENPKRHSVFRHTFPTALETQLQGELLKIAEKYIAPGKMNIAQVRKIAMGVFE